MLDKGITWVKHNPFKFFGGLFVTVFLIGIIF